MQKGFVILRVKDLCIAENTLIQAFFHRVNDAVRRSELHIRNPHSDVFVIGKREFPIPGRVENVFPPTVHVHTVAVLSVNHFVKIISHAAPPVKTFPSTLSLYK